MNDFTSLNLDKRLMKALAAEGYVRPTPIQARAIPEALAGRDIIGVAQTGSGKTAAFALPILHRLAADRRPAPRRGCRVLVLSPTRELASQIADSFRALGRHLDFTVAVVFGGVKYGPQVRALAGGVDILVATPGRLLDHLGEKLASLAGVETFVLDEADQMLDLGFLPPIRRILAQLPKRRQTLFFSATLAGEIGKLAETMLESPTRINVTPPATPVETIDQRILFVEAERKRAVLADLLGDPTVTRALVFTRTKRGADRVARAVSEGGVACAAIHGDKTQGQRERALAAFKAGEVRALIATDIAARGIDVEAVSHVINHDLPNVPEAYVHRIGRTARAGASGVAISLVADDERGLLRDIQKLIARILPGTDLRRERSGERGGAGEGGQAAPAQPKKSSRGRFKNRSRGQAGQSTARRAASASRSARSAAG